jgi:hypothetical protein
MVKTYIIVMYLFELLGRVGGGGGAVWAGVNYDNRKLFYFYA